MNMTLKLKLANSNWLVKTEKDLCEQSYAKHFNQHDQRYA